MKNLQFVFILLTLVLLGCQNKEKATNQDTSESSSLNQGMSESESGSPNQDVSESGSLIKDGQQDVFESGSLIEAVQNNDLSKVEAILKDTTYQIDETNSKQETPLLIATHNNYIDIAKLLIDAGANVNKQDSIQDSPYLYAGAQGKTEILTYMIEKSNPNQQIYNRFGGNALIPAAEKGHLENVKVLLKDGKVDIDHQNNSGYSALIEAVALTDGSKVYQDIVKELLSYQANTELRDTSGKTALDYALELNYQEIATLLKNHKK